MRLYLNTTGKLVLFPLTFFMAWVSPAVAQIVPDGTLGAERSIVTPLDTLRDRIDGGAIRGSNLFHSFQDFNIDDGRGAFFSNPTGIENILTRITGGNPSNIFGTLGVSGNANLFLINPNGIVFGPNARLDVGGSFFASTAEGITFLDGYEFSATNPDVPPLLTINVPIGLQVGANPEGIVNQSVATNDAGDVRGLSVPSGETLALVGGNVTLDGGNVQPRGGRVELGGLAGMGTVGVNADGSLSFPEGVERANVSLGNAADVNVRAGGGGEIAINAGVFQMSGGSTLRAGIESGMGVPDAQAGDIIIDATESIALSEASRIFNGVLSADSTGNAGDIDVTTELFSATGSSGIVNFTNGLGNGGTIAVRATDTRLETDSLFQSAVFSEGVGNAGDIDVSTGSLNITGLARLASFTEGAGNAGNVRVRAVDTISIDGSMFNPDGTIFSSGIQSYVEPGGIGNAGDVEISANSVSLSNGASVGSRTSARGDGGKVSIRAETVTFDSGSTVQNQVFETAVGNSGGIEIVTGSLFINNGSRLISDTFGRGNAGKIEIRAADTVVLAAPLALEDTDRSSISTVVAPDAVGNSQGINITTESLILRNAYLGTSTLGRGDAGQIAIQATEIVSENTNISSFIGPEAKGNSQGIEITTGSLSFSNSLGGIATFTQGEGNAGNISIRATDSVSLDNASIGSFFESIGVAEGFGEGGDISITARTLSLNNASLLAQTTGQGDAGNVSLRVTDSVRVTGLPGITTAVLDGGIGRGGDIEIETGDLFLGEGTTLLAVTLGRGDAGRVRIRARDSVTLDDSFISTGAFSNAVGNAQGIEIVTDSLSLSNDSLIDSLTNGQGDAGRVRIRARDSVTLDGSFISTGAFSNAVGDAQGIEIVTDGLSLSNGSLIESSTDGQGDAGQVRIQATDTVTLDNGRISTSAFPNAVGNAQGIEIVTDGLSLFNESLIDSLTNGQGDAGQVRIRATDAVILDSSRISASALSNAVGNARGIEITTNRLSLRNDALLDAFSSYDRGTAGEITVDANLIDLDRSSINASTLGGEGNINLNSQELVLRNNSEIDTDAFGEVTGGNITLNSDVIAALENSDISANAEEAFGGQITIATQGLFGTAFRNTQTPQSDITATSALGPNFSGTVEITPPEVDPASGLIGLPESPVDAASLFGKDFCSQRGTSQFVFTGRGGIPPSPFDPLGGSSPIELDWVEAPDSPEVEEPESRRESPSPVARPLIEAQGWVVAADGTIVLTAQPYQGTPAPPALSYPDCQTIDR